MEEIDGKKRIIVNEIPYQVNKSTLIEAIAELVKDKKIEGITDLRDESDRDGMRIVIELRKDAMEEIVLNQLFTAHPDGGHVRRHQPRPGRTTSPRCSP